MSKLKRLLTIGLASLFALGTICVSACQGMEDIIPETYGEWDGNYLYRGNGKSKTTGEDYERLVNTVEIDGTPYYAVYCVDSKIQADNMYMILACQKEDSAFLPTSAYVKNVFARDLDRVYCLVAYNLKDKTHKLLTTDQTVMKEDKEYFYRPTDIEGIFDDRIVLRAYAQETKNMGEQFSTNTMEWYTVDFDGALLDISIDYGNEWEWVSDEYLVAEIYNLETLEDELYYRTSALSEPILIYKKRHGDLEWSYVEQNGVKGVLIQDYYLLETPNKESWALGYLQFYNFATNKMSEPISIRKYARFFGNYTYLKTYKYKTVEYYTKWSEKDSALVETDNAVYRLVYDENGVHLEEFFDLTEGHSFTVYGVQEDKILYYEAWYQDHRGCLHGGTEYSYCEWDLTSGKGSAKEFEEIRALEDEYSAVYEQETGIAVGDYIYFLHEERISEGLMMPHSQAYMLKRRNMKTGELEVMQVWHERKNNSEDNRKFCEEFWFVGERDGADEFDFYEFTVRSY